MEYQSSTELPDGLYEVKVYLVTLNASANGSEYLDFNLEIRTDVEQPQQGRHVHIPLWRSKNNNSYSMKYLTRIAAACGLPHQQYLNLKDVMAAFKDKLVRVHLIHQNNVYRGVIYHDLKVSEWLQTLHPLKGADANAE